MGDGRVSLSEKGAARRRAIKDRIVVRLVRRRRRRRAAEALLAAACALLLLPIVQRGGGAPGPGVGPGVAPSGHAVLVQVRRVGDDPSVLARCRLAEGEHVRRLDDRALWAALAAAGRGGGLVKVEGSGVLLAGIATDPWRAGADHE